MTDKIGVLGESTVAAQGTNTAYTVPSGKGARVKLMYRGVPAVSSTFYITVNEIALFTAITATAAGVMVSTNEAMIRSYVAATSLLGISASDTVAPGPREYFLAAADTVKYVIGVADFSSMNFQVVGSEVDVA